MTESPAAGRNYKTMRWIAIVVILVSVGFIFRTLPIKEMQLAFRDWLEGLGPMGLVVFAVVYIVATVALAPASMLTLVGGAVFGIWKSFLAVSVASNIGAAIAFLIARYFARDQIERVAKANPRFAAVDEAISEGGWKVVAMLRLSPAVPFNLQNYLYGLTRVRFGTCVLTSWIAMIPGTFLYCYLGHVAGEAVGGPREKSLAEWILLGVGLLATLAVTIYITRLAQRKLREQTSITADEGKQTANEPQKPPFRLMAVALCLVLLAAIAFWKQDSLRKRFPKAPASQETDSGPD